MIGTLEEVRRYFFRAKHMRGLQCLRPNGQQRRLDAHTEPLRQPEGRRRQKKNQGLKRTGV